MPKAPSKGRRPSKKEKAAQVAFSGLCSFCEQEPDAIVVEQILDNDGYQTGLAFQASCHGMTDQLILEYAPYTGETVQIRFFSGPRSTGRRH